ncbi:hypothetical protein MTR67_017447, partial [Solanum verrucosum]
MASVQRQYLTKGGKCTQDKATISQLWSPQGWNLRFRRAFNDWEIERVINLFQVLNAFPGTSTKPDKPIWRWQSK